MSHFRTLAPSTPSSIFGRDITKYAVIYAIHTPYTVLANPTHMISVQHTSHVRTKMGYSAAY